MAVTVQELFEGIRAGVGEPEGTALADMNRILAYANEAIRIYASAAPEAVKDMAVIQLGQYLYDAPVAARRSPANALAESGVWAMLSPYREHRAITLDVDERPAGSTATLDVEAVLDLIAPWARFGSTLPIPADHLPAVGNLTLAQVRQAVLDDPEIVGFNEFETALRRTTTIASGTVRITTPYEGVAIPGAGKWPVTTLDREFVVHVGNDVSPSINYNALDAAGSVAISGSLSTSNSIGVRIGANDFFIGKTSTREIVFTSGTFGSYNVQIVDHVIDLKDEARLSGPPFPTGGGGGVDQAAVDGRVRALVAPQALRGNTVAWVASKLGTASEAARGAVQLATAAQLLAGAADVVATAARIKAYVEGQADVLSYGRTSKRTEVFNAFTGDGWATPVAPLPLMSTSFVTSAAPNNLAGISYAARLVTGVFNQNVYLAIKMPVGLRLANYRLNITDGFELVPLSGPGVTHVPTPADTAHNYYTVRLANVPASTNIVFEQFTPFELDANKVANTPALWARAGNDDIIPEAKLGDFNHPSIRELNNRPIGLFVASSASRIAANLTAFSNNLDLDDDPHGDITIVATASVQSGATFQIGPIDRVSFNVFNSEISALPVYNVRTPTQSLRLGGFQIHNTASPSVQIGTLGVYLGRQADGTVGYFIAYSNIPGHTGGLTGTIQVNIRALFIRSQGGMGATVVDTTPNHQGDLVMTASFGSTSTKDGNNWFSQIRPVVAPGAPSGYIAQNGGFNFPRLLTTETQGFVCTCTIGTTLVSRLYLPATPFATGQARYFTGGNVSNSYIVLASTDSTRRIITIEFHLQVSSNPSHINGCWFYGGGTGNDAALQDNTVLNFYEWV